MSEDHLKFMLIDDHDLHLYLSKKLPFAPIRRPISNTMTSSLCLPALLTNDTDRIARLCEKVLRVNATTDPTADYLGDGVWIVLSPEPIDLDIRCKMGQTVKVSHMIKTVEPLTLVKLKVGCGGFNTHFQLPIHFQVESHLEPYQIFQLNRTLHQNDVWNHFSSMLTEHNASLFHLIQTLPAVQNGQVTLSAIKTHLHTLRSQAHYHSQTVVIPAISVTSLVVCGLIVCIICKYLPRSSGLCLCFRTNRCIPSPNPVPGCSVPLQDCAAPTRDPTTGDLTRPAADCYDGKTPPLRASCDDTTPMNCSPQ